MIKTILTACFLFVSHSIFSQQSISASGGEATFSEGSVSYSIGQLFSSSQTGSANNTALEGAQQPREKLTYTFSSNDWSPRDPNEISFPEDNIYINSSGDIAFITSNTIFNTLTVEAGSALTINSGVTLKTNISTLNSTSNSFSSLIVEGTIIGLVKYNRFASLVGPVGSNDLISAPLAGQNFADFDSANANLPASGTLRAFAPYNTSAGAYQNYDLADDGAIILDLGKGYRAATTDGSTLEFTGTAANTDILDIPISDAPAGNAWNLIGNPYPSYIDFETFFNLNKDEFNSGGVYQAVYGYDGNSSDGWTVWNSATIADPNTIELIAPGQAFFVKAKVGGGSVDFTTAMRTTGNTDDFISGRQTNLDVALCSLSLTSASHTATTAIYFIEGTTRGLDVGYDAGAYSGSIGEFSIFSNLVADNTGLELAIQSLPYNDLSDIVVPIGLNATATVGLSIGLDTNTTTLPQNINVYLEDTLENTFTLLNTSDYTFTPSTNLSGTGRFYLRYESQLLTTVKQPLDYLQIYTITSTKEIVVKGQLNFDTEAYLYDLHGRLVLSKDLDPSELSNIINVSTISSGVYVLKLLNNSHAKTVKVIIN